MNLLIVAVIAITATGVTFLWRTCIYTRGGIFRFVGRALDHWVMMGSVHKGAGWHWKVLRFLAYPLGRCIFCSGFHFTYDIFFILNWKLGLGMDWIWLLIALPLSHLMIIMFDRIFCVGNQSIEKDDWHYMNEEAKEEEAYQDEKYGYKILSEMNAERDFLSKEDEKILEMRKSG